MNGVPLGHSFLPFLCTYDFLLWFLIICNNVLSYKCLEISNLILVLSAPPEASVTNLDTGCSVTELKTTWRKNNPMCTVTSELGFSYLNNLHRQISDSLDSKSFFTDKIWTRGKRAVWHVSHPIHENRPQSQGSWQLLSSGRLKALYSQHTSQAHCCPGNSCMNLHSFLNTLVQCASPFESSPPVLETT